MSTNSSQSLSPIIAPQVQAPPLIAPAPIVFPTSSQSIFVNTPITALPAYTSTSILTNQMTLACMQAKKQIKKTNTGSGNAAGQSQSKLKLESTVPTGNSNREWLENYWKQEKERYQNPLAPYTFTCLDGSKATVAPAAKKLLIGVGSKPRQHELLKNERPPYVTILSLVRDAAAYDTSILHSLIDAFPKATGQELTS